MMEDAIESVRATERHLRSIGESWYADLLSDAAEEMEWHGWISAKDDPPKEAGEYLAVTNYGRRRIQILTFVKDLEGLDPYTFVGLRKPGWVDYDSEWGFGEWVVDYWMPKPPLPKKEGGQQ